MPLSLEALSDIDGEGLFVSTLTADGEKTFDEVRQTPAVKELKAVEAGHVVSVNGSVWSTRGAPPAAGVVLDEPGQGPRRRLTGRPPGPWTRRRPVAEFPGACAGWAG
ncbi:hypothetical protein [Nonomuraea sp. NPDC049607]|uniref:hypothetical protein n=1 Tax=Nonomuraea sp. NPDC049607 TaxID=3154732 RepID=UPI00343BA062